MSLLGAQILDRERADEPLRSSGQGLRQLQLARAYLILGDLVHGLDHVGLSTRGDFHGLRVVCHISPGEAADLRWLLFGYRASRTHGNTRNDLAGHARSYVN